MDDAEWDRVFDVLGDVHRRRVLVALLEHNPQQETVQVPEGVHVGERELEALQLEMFHHHLPLLSNAGYVAWDRKNHEVTKGPAFEEIRSVLELLAGNRDELPEGFA